jgi:hypothetical protein
MSSSDIESLPTANTGGSLTLSRKWKIVASVAFLLGAVATAGVCATAVGVATTSGGGGSEGAGEDTRSLPVGGEVTEESGLVRNRRLPPNAQKARFRPPSSCYSEELNDTLPAAHIKGRRFEWENDGDVYLPEWDCDDSPAFVAGGMWFKQAENSLFVPKCGWYHVTSDIAFQNNGDSVESYSYTLRIERNCGTDNDDDYFRKANTVNAPVTGQRTSITSAHVNDVVKICSGGRIYVTIPVVMNACCPRGYSETTSIAAYLVSESDCEWPVPSHDEAKESYQK